MKIAKEAGMGLKNKQSVKQSTPLFIHPVLNLSFDTFSSSLTGSEALGFSPSATVSVVLEEDGTIVEDEAYFLCLPANTKFMLLHADEIWLHTHQSEI